MNAGPVRRRAPLREDAGSRLVRWIARPKGNVARLRDLKARFGEELVDGCVRGGWIEVRRARPGEVIRKACPCGADLEAVEAGEDVVWRCGDDFCLPVRDKAPLLVWTDEQVLRLAIRRQLGLRPGGYGAALGSLTIGRLSWTVGFGTPRRRMMRVRFLTGDDVGEVDVQDLVVWRGERLVVERPELARRLCVSATHAGPWLAQHEDLVMTGDGTVVWVLGEKGQVGPRSAAVLRLLAEREGGWCGRSELVLAAWPDEVTASGRALCGQDKLDRRLRQVIGELRRVLAPHEIGARRAAGAVEGAYCLGARVVVLG